MSNDSTLPPASAGASRPLRVVLADDQALVRSGFRLILSVEDDIEVVGEARDGAEAVRLVTELAPDIVLMDVQMPVLDGIAATAGVVAASEAKVIILTTFDRDDYLFAGLRAGASGFLLKNTEPERLVDAVRAVAEGNALLAPEVTRRVIAAMTTGDDPAGAGGAEPEDGTEMASVGAASPAGLAQLTEREREVLTHLARGLSNAEIAAELFVGEATVKTHVSNCLAKLHLRDRVQAVVLAYNVGLVTPRD